MSDKKKDSSLKKTPQKRGRPKNPEKQFREDFVRIAREVCLLGATVTQLARVLGVSPALMKTWYGSHPDFLAAIREGRDIYDSEEMESALKKRGKGFFHTEITKERVAVPDPDGPLDDDGKPLTKKIELLTTKEVKKYYPPETKAAMMWLWSRNPKRWPRQGGIGPETPHKPGGEGNNNSEGEEIISIRVRHTSPDIDVSIDGQKLSSENYSPLPGDVETFLDEQDGPEDE